ncbi:hypothetical protein KJ708_01220, partial [bacterium]|nr:hypothetical protein [bacterium]MBU1894589.1 hypothetical protein [Candidatus Omnitrophota bacterium]
MHQKTTTILLFLLVFINTGLSYAETIIYNTAITAKPSTIDPIKSRNTHSIHIGSQVHEGLLKLDDSYNVVPAVAESWKIIQTGKAIEFVIRDNARFHNGNKIEPEDVVYSLSRIIKNEEDFLFFRSFSNILGAIDYKLAKTNHVKGIYKSGSNKVTIELNHSD